MSQESAMHEEIEDLREALEAAKLREAEWNETLKSAAKVVCELTQERDAALSALRRIAAEDSNLSAVGMRTVARLALNNLSAALAERDRAVKAAVVAQLASYIQHHPMCRLAILNENSRCVCGLDAALKSEVE